MKSVHVITVTGRLSPREMDKICQDLAWMWGVGVRLVSQTDTQMHRAVRWDRFAH